MIYEAGVAPRWSAAKIPTRVWETRSGWARRSPGRGPRTWREKAQGVCPHQSHSGLSFLSFPTGARRGWQISLSSLRARCSVIPNPRLEPRKSTTCPLLLGTGVCKHFFTPAHAGGRGVCVGGQPSLSPRQPLFTHPLRTRQCASKPFGSCDLPSSQRHPDRPPRQLCVH